MMNRRSLLSSAGVTVSALLAGCPGVDDSEKTERVARPTDIVDWDFENGVRTEASLHEAPIVTIDRTGDSVTVEGIAGYGCSSCRYIDAIPPAYDAGDALLSVGVESRRHEDAGLPTDDYAADSYRTTVSFDEGIPDRIDVHHHGNLEAVSEPHDYHAEFAFDHTDGTLTVTHAGGHRFPAEDVVLLGDLASDTDGASWADVDSSSEPGTIDGNGVTVANGGDEYRWAGGHQDGDDATVLVVWRERDTPWTGTLATWNERQTL